MKPFNEKIPDELIGEIKKSSVERLGGRNREESNTGKRLPIMLQTRINGFPNRELKMKKISFSKVVNKVQLIPDKEQKYYLK